MKRLLAIIFVLTILPAVSCAQNTPLQPANQPEIFDFTGQVNDPNAPGNREGEGVRNYPEISQDQEQAAPVQPETAPLPAKVAGVDMFSIMMGALVVLMSAAAAGAWYWLKTRKDP